VIADATALLEQLTYRLIKVSPHRRRSMEILLTLTYVALCYFIFKLFRIRVNQWTLATAGLGGIFGLSLLFITMAYNHPFSTNARIYYTSRRYCRPSEAA
jgi:hypothetical protein